MFVITTDVKQNGIYSRSYWTVLSTNYLPISMKRLLIDTFLRLIDIDKFRL